MRLRLFRLFMGGLIATTAFTVAALAATPVNATPFTFRSVSTGYHRTCAVTPDGIGVCWGWNYNGSLATTDTASSVLTPSVVSLPAGESFRSIEAGSYFMSCGLAQSGNVYCWGEGGSVSRVQFPNGTVVSQLSVGASQGCVITTDARLYCWGDWNSGEVGVGDFEPTNLPQRVTLPDGAIPAHVSAGVSFTCATATNGAAYCWGSNGDGQLGNGTTTMSKVPVRVIRPAGVSFATASAGLERACAVDTNGGGWCWGRNYSGAFGDGTYTNSATPRQVALPADTTLTSLRTGWYHTCAITTTGSVLCWGENSSGALGWGGTFGGKTIRTAALPDGAVAANLSAGLAGTCVALVDGRIYCWGANLRGSVGTGTTASSLSPQQILPVGTPDVAEPVVSDVTTRSARVSARFVANGATTTLQVLVATTSTFSDARRISVDLPRSIRTDPSRLFTGVDFAVNVTSLRPATDYFVKVRASNTFGASESATTSFTSLGGPPTVLESAWTAASGDTASVTATVDPNQLETSVTVSYSTDPNLNDDVRNASLGTATGTGSSVVNGTITGLAPRTTYWARITATNEVGSDSGDAFSFTTRGSEPTIVSAEAVGGRRAAVVNIEVSSGGLPGIVSVSYRKVGDRGAWSVVRRDVAGEETTRLDVPIDRLAPATDFDVTVKVSNVLGTAEMTGIRFTTLGGAPLIDNAEAIDVADTTVTLRGTVDSNDFATRVVLQIDTSDAFTNPDEWFAGSLVAGSSTRISLDVSELIDSTTYFARLVATNSRGSTIGSVVTFTTSTPVGKLLKRRTNPVDPVPVVEPTPIVDSPVTDTPISVSHVPKSTNPKAGKVTASSAKGTKAKAPKKRRGLIR